MFWHTECGILCRQGGGFMNIKMDKLIARLGITIRYSPVYSLWSNGINEQNHASCDVTVNKLMEKKKGGSD